MKIILTSETSIRLVPTTGPMTIEAQSVDQQYSPFHMLGSSLAFCTFSVMYSWATQVNIPVDDLTLDVSWEFESNPQRVSRLDMTFDWPSLPEKRRNAARRAAELCTIHATLHHPPVVTVRAVGEAPTPAGTMDQPTRSEADPMSSSKEARDRAPQPTREQSDSREHAHEHTHADGTQHSHPHVHEGEHAHEHRRRDALTSNDVEIRHGSDEGNGAADLPPRPATPDNRRDEATTPPPRRSNEAR